MKKTYLFTEDELEELQAAMITVSSVLKIGYERVGPAPAVATEPAEPVVVEDPPESQIDPEMAALMEEVADLTNIARQKYGSSREIARRFANDRRWVGTHSTPADMAPSRSYIDALANNKPRPDGRPFTTKERFQSAKVILRDLTS